jgi:hypothetical protein
MLSRTSLAERRLSALSTAIFAKREVFVAEAYSAFGMEPIQFEAPEALLRYGANNGQVSCELVHLVVCYPDMLGRVVRKRIDLNPEECAGHRFRYTYEGWGLIWVHLEMSAESPVGSFVAANSQKRAEKWAPTNSVIDAPGTWCWPAVGRHSRRLERALAAAV